MSGLGGKAGGRASEMRTVNVRSPQLVRKNVRAFVTLRDVQNRKKYKKYKILGRLPAI